MNITKNKKNLNPLFIGFGNQALEYANVLRFLNIRISNRAISLINKLFKGYFGFVFLISIQKED